MSGGTITLEAPVPSRRFFLNCEPRGCHIRQHADDIDFGGTSRFEHQIVLTSAAIGSAGEAFRRVSGCAR